MRLVRSGRHPPADARRGVAPGSGEPVVAYVRQPALQWLKLTEAPRQRLRQQTAAQRRVHTTGVALHVVLAAVPSDANDADTLIALGFRSDAGRSPCPHLAALLIDHRPPE